MGDNLDKKLRENSDNKIPEGIDLMIENTLSNLPSKKRKDYKKVAIAAGLSCLIFSGAGLGVTASAIGKTVKEIVYELLGYKGEDDILKEIYKKQSKDGIDFTVTNLGYSDDEITVSYTLKSAEYVKQLKDNNMSDIFAQPRLYNGEKNIMSSGTVSSKVISENEIVGVFTMDLKGYGDFKKIKDNGVENLIFGSEIYIGNKETEFKVEIPLDEPFFMENIKTYKFDNKIIGRENLDNSFSNQLEKVSVSTLKLTLDFNPYYIEGVTKEERAKLLEKMSNNGYDNVKKEFKYRDIDYKIFDDKGKELVFDYGGGDSDLVRYNYKTNQNMKKIYIVPCIQSYYTENNYRFIDAKIKNGLLEIKENKDFKFKIEKLNDKTRIHFEANTPYLNDSIEIVKDKNTGCDYNGDKKTDEYEYKFSKNINTDYNKGYFDIPNTLKDGDYKIKYVTFDAMRILKDEMVEIDLEK